MSPKVNKKTSKGYRTRKEDTKSTVLIYSPDLNFCFALATLFQNRFNVVTITNPELLETSADHYSADLVIMDAEPSEKVLSQLDGLKSINDKLPIIMLYVYEPKGLKYESCLRERVDSVFYKPFDVTMLSKRIEELLPV